MANSSKLVLPIMMAFLAFNFSTTVASKTGLKLASILLAAVVVTPSVNKLSLIPIGIPANKLSASIGCASILAAAS